MLRFLKSFFGKHHPSEPVAPYKVEAPLDVAIAEVVPVVAAAPEPMKCGCGRSTTGFCVGLHKLSDAEWAAHPDNPVKPAATPAKKPAAKKVPAKKAPAAKKPRAKKEAK